MSTDLYVNHAAENVYEYDISTPNSSQKHECDHVKSGSTSNVQSFTFKLVCLLTVSNIALIIVIPVLYFQSEAKWQGGFHDAIANIETKMENDTVVSEARFYKLEQTTNHATRKLMQENAKMMLIIAKHSNEINEISKDLKGKFITDCSKVHLSNSTTGNVSRETYKIFAGGQQFNASCDLSTDGGRWTVIQRRMNGLEDFYRNHFEYVKGFGSVTEEFWIGNHQRVIVSISEGLDNLYNILETSARFELRIDMEDWDGAKRYAKYSLFDVGRPEEDYPLHVSGYSGNAGDSLTVHSGAKFSTKDRDLDTHSSENCAQFYKGAWWYKRCHSSNLNGLYHEGGTHDSYADGVNWYDWKGHHYSLKFVEMKVRPSST